MSDPQSWNRYASVEGDPINFNDPQGTCSASVSAGGETVTVDYDCTPVYPVESRVPALARTTRARAAKHSFKRLLLRLPLLPKRER